MILVLEKNRDEISKIFLSPWWFFLDAPATAECSVVTSLDLGIHWWWLLSPGLGLNGCFTVIFTIGMLETCFSQWVVVYNEEIPYFGKGVLPYLGSGEIRGEGSQWAGSWRLSLEESLSGRRCKALPETQPSAAPWLPPPLSMLVVRFSFHHYPINRRFFLEAHNPKIFLSPGSAILSRPLEIDEIIPSPGFWT